MQTKNFNEIFGVLKDFVPPVSSGTLVVVLCSCVWFGIQTSLSLPQDSLSIGASVFQRGHFHRLFLYPFQNRSLPQLLLSSTALLFLCAGVEKGFGTVRFLFLVFLLASFTGVFYSFLDLLQDASVHTEGLLPVVLACVALTTLHTKMSKAFLCGISFPAVAIPWVLLIICTALIPHSVLLCNVIAILIGWVYGKGWLSYLDLSESRAAVLEKILPFKLLRGISGAMFVPASSQKRKTLLPRINPTPGSYPVQAYALLPSISTTATPDTMFEGWPNSVGFKPPHSLHGQVSAQNVGHNHGHFSAQNVGHDHGHFSAQNVGHDHGHFSAQNVGHDHGHFSAQNVVHNHGHFLAQNVGHSHEHFLDQSMGHSCNHNHGHSHGPEQ